MPLSRRAFLGTLGAGGAALTLPLPAVHARGLEAAMEGLAALAPGVNGPLRLDSNENPLGPLPAALDAIRGVLTETHRYPYQARSDLRDAIAARLRVAPEQVLVGCGSGEVLRVAVDAFTSPTRGLVTAAPTYEGPTGRAQVLGVPIAAPPLDRSLRLDLDAMTAAARTAGLVFLCNPNNPSGTLYSGADMRTAIQRMLRAAPEAMILVDEAYDEYVTDRAYESMLPLALMEPRVIVSRTFSKIYGIAGLRSGYALGHADTMARMSRHILANAVSVVASAASIASLRAESHVPTERQRNADVRAWTARFFTDLGYTVAPSEANFVFVDIRRPVAPVREALRARNVAVGRPFPPLEQHLRVSIGTMDEMRQAAPMLRDVLGRA